MNIHLIKRIRDGFLGERDFDTIMKEATNGPSREVMAEGDPNESSIGVTKYTIDRILRLEHYRADALALYLFYAYTSRWQHTMKVRATNTYVANGLGWGVDKVKRVKQALMELDLISNERVRVDGRITEWRVQVRYVLRTIGVVLPPMAETLPIVDRTGIEKKEKKTGKASRFSELPPELSPIQETWDEWLAYRKARRSAMTEQTFKRQVAMLTRLGATVARASLEQSMAQGWTGLFEPKRNGKPKMSYRTREDKINRLNERKRDLMRMRRTPAIDRELAAIQADLLDL
jgi:hypothetical protein